MTVTGIGGSAIFNPKWLCPEHPLAFSRRGARRYGSLAEFCRQEKPRKVCLHRTYALGDVLMLLPVARLFRRLLQIPEPVVVAIGAQAFGQLGAIARMPDVRLVEARGIRDYGCAVHMDLNRCLEADHRGGPESDYHRLELYARKLGIP